MNDVRSTMAQHTAVIAIRPASPADAGPLAALAERTFRGAFAAQNRAEDLAAYIDRAYGESRQRAEIIDAAVDTLLAEVDQALVGFAQLRQASAPSCVAARHPVELWRLYVDAPWHGRGVAQALMKGIESAARRREADALWLGVWNQNVRAQAFYRKCGYAKVGEHVFVLGGDVQTDDVMLRSLLT
jgi:ribosomal protein S18 acetylase RimI-like enzyme